MNGRVNTERSLAVQESFAFFEQPGQQESRNRGPDLSLVRNKAVSSRAFVDFTIDQFPEGELTELVCADPVDSIYALLPELSRYSDQNRWLTLIAPPMELDERLFSIYGVDTSRILIVHPDDTLRGIATMNNALKQGNSSIVVFWSDNVPQRYHAQWRKSVKQGNSIGVWVNLGPESNQSVSIAQTAVIIGDMNYIKVVSRLQYGEEVQCLNEIILPRINLSALRNLADVLERPLYKH